MCCRLIFCSVPASFSRLNSDSLRMSSAFKSTIYENSRIHDNQVHAYGHVHGRWETKQRMTLIPKLRSDRKLFWPPFCSCLCFRCIVRCISVGSTDSFLVPGSWEKYETSLIYIFFVLFFCLLLHRLAVSRSVCRFIFFYKLNCTNPGLQLGDSAPLIGL